MQADAYFKETVHPKIKILSLFAWLHYYTVEEKKDILINAV